MKRIPYFGKNSNDIMLHINKAEIEDTIETDLYSFVINNISNDIVFVFEDYVYAWVSDIKFNYRDKECYIPYYKFDLYYDTDRLNDNNGHLIIKDNKRYIRYNFDLATCKILLNTYYICYSVSQQKKFKIIFNRYYTGLFSINTLYKLYINSCYSDDNYLVVKHEGGYHYINKKTDSYKNLEGILRVKYDLREYKNKEYIDYRDVREYKYIELVDKLGLIENSEIYKIRRLRFESYLYCNLREENQPMDYDKDEWNKLGKTYDYIKYYGYDKQVIPLFIKSYWLNDNLVTKKVKNKTYMRLQNGTI